jgi:hypothetical protein
MVRCVCTPHAEKRNRSYLPLTENPSVLELTYGLLPLSAIVLEGTAARHDKTEVKNQKYEKRCMATTAQGERRGQEASTHPGVRSSLSITWVVHGGKARHTYHKRANENSSSLPQTPIEFIQHNAH